MATARRTSAAICSKPTSILAERDISDDDLRHVLSLAERILEQPMVVIEGVEETLGYLSERHELTLFTKGHPDEQLLKVDRSGSRPLFRAQSRGEGKRCRGVLES